MLVLCYKYDMFVVGWDNPSRNLRRGLGQPLAQLAVGWDNPSRNLRRGLGQPLAQLVVGWDNPSRNLRRGLGQPLAQLVVGWDNPSRTLRRGLGQPLTQIIVGWDNPSQKHLSSRAGITPRAPNGLGFTPHRIPRVYKLLVLICLIVVSDTPKPRPTHPSQSRQGIG
jgi:hypothetical protein